MNHLWSTSFTARNLLCSAYIPDYANISSENLACDAVGAVPGQLHVIGAATLVRHHHRHGSFRPHCILHPQRIYRSQEI
jgi:hypothetical protein